MILLNDDEMSKLPVIGYNVPKPEEVAKAQLSKVYKLVKENWEKCNDTEDFVESFLEALEKEIG